MRHIISSLLRADDVWNPSILDNIIADNEDKWFEYRSNYTWKQYSSWSVDWCDTWYNPSTALLIVGTSLLCKWRWNLWLWVSCFRRRLLESLNMWVVHWLKRFLHIILFKLSHAQKCTLLLTRMLWIFADPIGEEDMRMTAMFVLHASFIHADGEHLSMPTFENLTDILIMKFLITGRITLSHSLLDRSEAGRR